MKKIVHILNTNSFSGAENVVITLISQMNKIEGYKCIYVSKDGPIRNILSNEHIEFYPLKKLTIRELKKMYKDIKPDIIHSHDFTASIMSSFSIRKVPIVSHLHNNPLWIKTKNFKTLIYKFTLKRYPIVLTVSDAVRNEFIYSDNFIKQKTISNPIDIKSIRETQCKDTNIEPFDLMFLGRLDKQKDPLRFINIVNEIKLFKPDVLAYMLGDGSMRKECEDKINELNLNENVRLIGFKENRFDYLRKAKILCITSKWEGFGLMAVEALAFGVPVLSTGVGGLANIVNDKCGFICKNNDDFIFEAKKLLTDCKYYNKKSEGAYYKANSFNNINDYIATIKKIYEDILKK